MPENKVPPVECPRCGKPMRSGIVETAIWSDDRLIVVEDVPAQTCDACLVQFYDAETTAELRLLVEDGIPFSRVKAEILVPILSLRQDLRKA